jgi:hypothetical protein
MPIETSNEARFAAALECQVGKSRVAFPTAGILQLIEYDVAGPLPLARRWVAGAGLHHGRALLSVSLQSDGGTGLPYQRRALGVWLKSPSEEGCVYAVEVQRSLGLVNVVAVEPVGARSPVPLPAWLMEAHTSDGRCIGWVEPSELVRDLEVGVGGG